MQKGVTENEELFAAIHKTCIAELDTECVPCGYRIWDAFPIKNSGKRDMEKIKATTGNVFIPKSDEI